MIRANKFRLYPNKEQERELLRTKEVCRKACNRLLEEYNKGEHDRFKLQALLPVWKEEDEELRNVHSKVSQMEAHHLFADQRGLEERRKRGRKVGKLRPKSENRFKSFTHNLSGFELPPGNEKWGMLHLSKIGDIPIRLHREVKGKIKGVTIKHMPSGEWFACLAVDDGKGEDEITFIEKAVGIDLGLEPYTPFVQVDARGMSVECSVCGEDVPKTLKEREHLCPHCGAMMSRDHNASINILNRGIEKVRSERPELTLVDRTTSTPSRMEHVDWMKQEVLFERTEQFTIPFH